MKNIILTSIVLLSANSFAFVTPLPVPVPTPKPIAVEPVVVKEMVQRADFFPGPSRKHIVETAMEVEVMSGGCTKASDFQVNVMSTGRDQLINIVRVNPDPCDALSAPVTVTIETTKLGLASSLPIRVANPLLVTEHVTH